MPLFKDLLDKWTRPPEEVRSENLALWASTVGDAERIADLQPRAHARAAGVIQRIRIDPGGSASSIEASISDGTGRLEVRWFGRTSMPGIKLGMGLIVEGTVGASKREGLTMMNPTYQLVPGPEHG